jgi:hypothetical protein
MYSKIGVFVLFFSKKLFSATVDNVQITYKDHV